MVVNHRWGSATLWCDPQTELFIACSHGRYTAGVDGAPLMGGRAKHGRGF